MFKKIKKGKLKKFELKTNKLIFGNLGLKAIESGIINFRQIEAARQVISRKTKKKAKIWIKVFSNLSITAKPTGIRMGKGKGEFSNLSARVSSGSVLIEICGTNKNMLIAALKAGKSKLALKTKIFN